MENKTISYLNSKIWYRFLKVVYIIFFVPIFIIALCYAYFTTQPTFDVLKSYVKCNDGVVLSYQDLADNKVFLYGGYIWNDDDAKIRAVCSITDNEKTISFEKNYNLVSVYTQRDWGYVVLISVVLLLIVTFIFELIKRLFYYIVLGNLRPKSKL